MTAPALFHGTRAGFRGRGGLVLPAHQTGRPSNHPDLEYRSDWVYVTPDLDLAWAYAQAAQGRGRPKVLEVAPGSDLQVDDSTVGGGQDQVSFRCTHAYVLRTITTRVEP